jgi:hypothetical protein
MVPAIHRSGASADRRMTSENKMIRLSAESRYAGLAQVSFHSQFGGSGL